VRAYTRGGVEARSEAKVGISEGKGGPGMSTLVVFGDDRASESVRMMVNNGRARF
jgi:hypothetical protein